MTYDLIVQRQSNKESPMAATTIQNHTGSILPTQEQRDGMGLLIRDAVSGDDDAARGLFAYLANEIGWKPTVVDSLRACLGAIRGQMAVLVERGLPDAADHLIAKTRIWTDIGMQLDMQGTCGEQVCIVF